MKLTDEQKAKILEKVERLIDEWELGVFDAIQETVFEDFDQDTFLALRLCIRDEL